MVSKFVIVELENGLNATNASAFVNLTGKFTSSIKLKYKNKELDAKSIMGLMSLALYKSSEVTIVVDGPDQVEALEAVSEFLIRE